MPHDHAHTHVDPEAGDARVAWAVAVNLGLTLAQVVGGLLSGSLALIADALHNFSDAVALIIAVLARRIARRPADAEMSFGYGRAEMVAALVNYTTLVLLALYLAYEGIMRLITPEPIAGWTVVWIAALALIALLAVQLVQPVDVPSSEPGYVADIAADDNSLRLLAVYDPAGATLRITRTAGAALDGRVLELWAIQGDAAPVSLGVLPEDGTASIALPEPYRSANGLVLAVSDEPPGGSPTGAPTGAVLAIGQTHEL